MPSTDPHRDDTTHTPPHGDPLRDEAADPSRTTSEPASPRDEAWPQAPSPWAPSPSDAASPVQEAYGE